VHLDFDDVLRADVIQQLMCPGSVHITAIERRYAIDFQDVLCGRARRLRPLAADRLVDVDDHRITATSRGRLLLRIIAMCLHRYRNEWNLSATEPRFSRAI